MPSSEKARRIARQHNREMRSLEWRGIRAAEAIGKKIRVSALKAYIGGRDVGNDIQQTTALFEPIILDAMVAGYLTGYLQSIRTAGRKMAEIRKAAGPYDATFRFLKARMDLTDEQLTGLVQSYGNEAAKVTREMSVVVEAKAQQAVATIVSEGQHVREGVVTLRNSFTAAGVTPQNPYLLETLVRTQTVMAYSAAQWQANEDPAIQEILWGYEYVTAGDDRVRPNHEIMDGTSLPKDDPFWSENFPPNGFSCRCDAIEVFKDEKDLAVVNRPETMTIEGAEVRPIADEGWRFNPGQIHTGSIDLLKSSP